MWWVLKKERKKEYGSILQNIITHIITLLSKERKKERKKEIMGLSASHRDRGDRVPAPRSPRSPGLANSSRYIYTPSCTQNKNENFPFCSEPATNVRCWRKKEFPLKTFLTQPRTWRQRSDCTTITFTSHGTDPGTGRRSMGRNAQRHDQESASKTGNSAYRFLLRQV